MDTDTVLQRHIQSIDKQTRLDPHGFLDLQHEGSHWADPASSSQQLADLIGTPNSFVLLAAGGVGKTTSLNALRNHELNAISINLKVLDKRSIREEIAQAKDSGGSIYLDAIDEAALVESAIFWILEESLTRNDATNVRWRLACRPSAWTREFADSIRATHPDFQELRLLPLTKSAALNAVADVTRNPEEFIQMLINADLGRLSATPKHLITTAARWEESGVLPGNRLEAMDFEIQELLSETNSSRPQDSNLTLDRAVNLAGRLGAFTLFSGINRFARGSSSSSGVATIAELPSESEPDSPGSPITPSQYEEVLRTALFDAAPDAAVSFRHQQYAEYLAARYLVYREVPPQQVQDLLGVHNSNLLPGTMVGVASWLAALSPESVEDLVDANALAFAKAGVEIPSSQVRARIVKSILTQASAGDIDPDRGVDLSGLIYSDIGEYLASYLEDGLQRPEELWWISELARAARCGELTRLLLSEALSTNWPDWARYSTVNTIAALGTEEEVLQLRPLLTLPHAEDPNDKILAATIEAMYPKFISTEELLDVLRPMRNSNLVGSYLILLGELSAHIPEPDLRPALIWAARNIPGEQSYGRFPQKLIERAWNSSEWLEIKDALAQAIASFINSGQFEYHDIPSPWQDASVHHRLEFTTAVARFINEEDWFKLLDWRLLSSVDARAVIDELPYMPQEVQTIFSACLPYIIREPSAALADLVLDLASSHPAYDSTRWLRESISLSSETAIRHRSLAARRSENRSALLPAGDLRRKISSELEATKRDPLNWWTVPYWLSDPLANRDGESFFTHDLTMRAGWRLLDREQEEEFIELGLKYLEAHQPEPACWFGQNTVQLPDVLKDWSGLYLLTTLLRYRPAQISSVSPAAWRKLVPVIVGAWDYDEKYGHLRCDLVDAAPLKIRQTIVDCALEHLDHFESADRILSPQRLYAHLIGDLEARIVDALRTDQYSDHLSSQLLQLLVDHLPHRAVDVCRSLSRPDTKPKTASTAQRTLARIDPQYTVSILEQNPGLLRSRPDVVKSINIDILEDHELCELGRLFLDHFSYVDDPPINKDPLLDVRQKRTDVLHRLAERGKVAELQQLSLERPEPDQQVIKRIIRDARLRAADLSYRRVSADDMIRLIGQGDRRLVRHEADLARVIISEIERLQHQIKKKDAFRDLWNMGRTEEASYPKSEDDISDWIQRHLESRLAGGVVVNREVQVSRPRTKGFGTRIDLNAIAPTATQPILFARVIIEAKLVSNSTLFTAVQDQLIDKYLAPTENSTGIFLVYWVDPDQRPSHWPSKGPIDKHEMLMTLQDQAKTHSDDYQISVVVLDISRPE